MDAVGRRAVVGGHAARNAAAGRAGGEAEPNNSAATASAIASGQRVRATVHPSADADYFTFSAQAGDRVFAAVTTTGSAGSQDTPLNAAGQDGTTVIEFDEDNGSLAGASSSIAGATIPTSGTTT